MNNKLLTVLYVIFVTRIEAFTNDEGNEISSRQIETCDIYPEVKCSSDCTSLLICHDENSPPLHIKCPSSKPYCLNGRCGITNGNCRMNTNSFTCTSNGTFPDPTDCTKSYVCNGANSTQYTCPSGFIFNSKLNICVRGTPRVDHASRKICQKISCDNKPNGYILFPANPAFYAKCSNDGGIQNMTMYKCSDIDNFVFDLTLEDCIFKCKSPGVFADPLNCSSYYFCEGWIKFKFTKLDCGEGQYFNGTGCVYGMNCGSPTEPPDTSPPAVDPEAPSVVDPEAPPIDPNVTSTPPSVPFLHSDQVLSQVTKTTKSPFPYYSLWKHKGKYSIRVAKSL